MMIFVTGGSGSFGRAFLSKMDKRDCTLVIYSNDEAAHSELSRSYPRHEFVLGDIRDCDWMACKMHGCTHVIHAAAFKGVPDVERNPIEAIKTNVQGSINVAMAADRAGVPILVALSSDKACEPVSVYGYTKALMEAVLVNAHTWARNTSPCVVRLGNFICSRGSVIPLFLKQGRKLTITDRRMTRFWMTMDQVVQWVLYALNVSRPHVIAPKLLAMPTIDVARCVSPDAEVIEMGMRPGERLHEFMVGASETSRAMDHGEYFAIHPRGTHFPDHDGPGYSSEFAPRWSEKDMIAAIEEWKRG